MGQRRRMAERVAGVGACLVPLVVSQLIPATATAATPALRATPPVVVQLAAGHADECAVLATRRVECWGWNQFGQLGNGTTTSSNLPVLVRGLAHVRQVAVGFGHACALLESGTMRCWGWDNDGQLGDESTSNALTPVAVRGLSGVTQISLGFAHTCALRKTGRVECWGWNFYGQLGDGSFTSQWRPTPVRGLGRTISVAAGYGHTCAILSNRSVKCWGWNHNGELGNGTTTSTTHPVPTRGVHGAVQLSLGFVHTCALLTTHRVMCWGRNNDGQLGDGTTRTSHLPVTVHRLGNVTGIAAGYGHDCALLATGRVECWGLNEFGQLGTGSPPNRATPTPTTQLEHAVEITVGDDSSCALLVQHVVSCWGSDKYGQLGDGTRHNVYRPPYLPSSPRHVRVSAHGDGALVTWSAPARLGAGGVTEYTVLARDRTTPSNGGQRCSWQLGPLDCAVSGLTYGDTYTFSVRATDLVGTGPVASATSAVTPATTPNPPLSVFGVAGDAAVVVTWSAPDFDGGNPITRYDVSAADATDSVRGGQTCEWTSGPLTCTIVGLTNGDDYTFTVIARNGVGASAASTASSAVTPATVPEAPTIVSVAPGNGDAQVSWSAPAFDGGSTVTGYTATASDQTTPANGGQSCTWTSGALRCTVSGLTNGDAYAFTVTATNKAGTGSGSSPSSAVTPATVPDAPSGVGAVPGDGDAEVTWSAPASDGGNTISGYTASATDLTTPANGGESCQWTSGPLTCTVGGLSNGDDYTFAVTATNGVGTGSASSSGDVTPATVPGAPSGVSAVAGNGDAQVSWSSPASDGGSTIISYSVSTFDVTTSLEVSPGCTWTSGPRRCTVSGLTNGDSYTFTVTATNGVGTGTGSAPSSSATPATVPDAPTGVSGVAGDSSIQVTWSAPDFDGGSTITSYTATATDQTNPGSDAGTCGWTSGPLDCTITGLTNGDAYTLTVIATNGVGTGGTSSPSGDVTPATVPDAPTEASALATDASATVTWSAPGSDGGSTISGYTVVATDSTTPSSGGESCAWTSGPLFCTVSGLTDGDSYTFTVSATNGVGTGGASAPSNAVIPATVPGAPTSVSATPGDTTADVTWSAPDTDGGSAIQSYTVTAVDETTPGNGGASCTWTSGELGCTVTGLTDGDLVAFTVVATNLVGSGSPSDLSDPVLIG